MWIRRQATEFDDEFERQFFADIIQLGFYKGYEFKCKINKSGLGYGYIKRPKSENWEVFITFVPLSIALKHKSIARPDCMLIIYDEFIIDTSLGLRYLKNEAIIFMEFYESVGRLKGTKVIFLGNTISVINPYFNYFKVKIDVNKEWHLKDEICIWLYANDEFLKMKESTRWGKFISGTKYGDYNMKNVFYKDKTSFIESRSNKSQPAFALKYDEKLYGVWRDYDKGLIYLSYKFDPTRPIYSLTTGDHDYNLLMLSTISNNKLIKALLSAWDFGYIRFEDLELKNDFYNILAVFGR